jgi:hypothetical protein
VDVSLLYVDGDVDDCRVGEGKVDEEGLAATGAEDV